MMISSTAAARTWQLYTTAIHMSWWPSYSSGSP